MKASAFSPQLVIMAKAPVAGTVKTRLARTIGVGEATSFYRAMTAGAVRRLTRTRRWKSCLAVSPDRCVAEPFWPAGIDIVPQGPGDLGDRMGRLFERLPPGPVVIIGTDIPAIEPADIERAFKALGANDAVLGPAPDGGYWLIGLRRTPRVLKPFPGVRWSSPDTLADTRANLEGARVALLRELNDIDTAEDYRAWRSGL